MKTQDAKGVIDIEKKFKHLTTPDSLVTTLRTQRGVSRMGYQQILKKD